MATSHTCCGRWVPNSGPQEEQQSCGPGIGSQPLLTVLVTDPSQPAACNTPLDRGHTLLRAFKPGTQQLTTGLGQAPSRGCPPQFLSFIPVAGRTQWVTRKYLRQKLPGKTEPCFHGGSGPRQLPSPRDFGVGALSASKREAGIPRRAWSRRCKGRRAWGRPTHSLVEVSAVTLRSKNDEWLPKNPLRHRFFTKPLTESQACICGTHVPWATENGERSTLRVSTYRTEHRV